MFWITKKNLRDTAVRILIDCCAVCLFVTAILIHCFDCNNFLNDLSYLKMSQKVSNFLTKQQQSSNASYWVTFDELYNKKLWHQLTIKLLEFIHKEQPRNLVEIYENFISDFETRIKCLSLVEIAVFIVKEISNHEEKLQFLEKIKGKIFYAFLIFL